VISSHQNTGQNRDVKIAKRSFANVTKFRCLRATVINLNLIYEELNAYWIQVMLGTTQFGNIFSSCLMSKNVKSRIYKTIILPMVLYVCENLFLTLRDKHRPRVFLNMVQRRIFGSKNDEIIDGWRQLCNEELHNLHSSQNTGRFSPCWPVHGWVLHGDQCTTGCEAHMNFADERVSLISDNVCN
jgi:hypothetical protein